VGLADRRAGRGPAPRRGRGGRLRTDPSSWPRGYGADVEGRTDDRDDSAHPHGRAHAGRFQRPLRATTRVWSALKPLAATTTVSVADSCSPLPWLRPSTTSPTRPP
jgi:hypothetical protein